MPASCQSAAEMPAAETAESSTLDAAVAPAEAAPAGAASTSFAPKTVLLGVTGCIAAYKACEVVRLLQKAGVRVKVVMTPHAAEFVGPLTFRALTHEPVGLGLFEDPSNPIHHISLAQEADLFLIAPCTANVMAKVAHGIADDLLTTTALATPAPLVLAPAMNVHMYQNAATQSNIALLRSRGVVVIDADAGYQACGDVGAGRLPEPAALVAVVLEMLQGTGLETSTSVDASQSVPLAASQPALAAVSQVAPVVQDLLGTSIMVTAGPTVEPIDPVRYVSNHSSGKFGYAIAAAAVERGASVTLVSGPVSLPAPSGVNVVSVRTAREMLAACEEAFDQADAGIFAAAVADVRPVAASNRKLKKGKDDAALASIELTENPDILSTLGHGKAQGQLVVGFAAETDDVVENARKKLERKNADMIVANDVSGGAVFGQDEDDVVFVTHDGARALPHLPKTELAHRILDELAGRLAARKSEFQD